MLLRTALRHVRDRIVRPRDHGVIFSRIHRENAWGDAESASGSGSTRARAAAFLDDLVATLHDLELRATDALRQDLSVLQGDELIVSPGDDHHRALDLREAPGDEVRGRGE